MNREHAHRSRPFLDDPAAYPEYYVLTQRHKIYHCLIRGLHRNRTAALIALLAVCVAASGAAVPASAPWSAGDPTETRGEWIAYLAEGLGLGLLATHFEGLPSAACCMAIIVATCLLVYPLRAWMAPTLLLRTSGLGRDAQPFVGFLAWLLCVGFPSCVVWGVAAWGGGFFRWGMGSGLAVGALSACLTLKSWSFFQESSSIETQLLARRGGKSGEASSSSRSMRSPVHMHSGERSDEQGDEQGDATRAQGGDDTTVLRVDDDIPSGGVQHRAPSSGFLPQQFSGVGGVGDCMIPPPEHASTEALTFWEFVYFLLVAPPLVCDHRCLKSGARLPPNVLAAASQFLHAALTFLVVHACSVSLFAPCLRLVSAASASESWTAFDETTGGLRCDRESGGGWVTALVWPQLSDGGAAAACEDGLADLEAENVVMVRRIALLATAAGSGMLVFSPLMHFLMFYGFFHCLCVGSAELWGYPDRDIYGPWWLINDDIRDYYRTWSAPVHRWLRACVMRPMVDVGHRWRGEAARIPDHDERRGSQEPGKKDSSLPHQGNQPEGVANGRGDAGGKMDCGDGGGGGSVVWLIMSATLVFVLSGVLHEAVGYVAMRRTIFPINTFFLLVSASSSPNWDSLFPVVRDHSNEEEASSSARLDQGAMGNRDVSRRRGGADLEDSHRTVAGRVDDAAGRARGEASRGGRVSRASSANSSEGLGGDRKLPDAHKRTRPPVGSYRGWPAVCVYVGGHLSLLFVYDFLCWRWWRWAHGSG